MMLQFPLILQLFKKSIRERLYFFYPANRQAMVMPLRRVATQTEVHNGFKLSDKTKHVFYGRQELNKDITPQSKT